MPPSWMNIMSTVYPDIYDIGLHVKPMDIRRRSAIIKRCQSQKSPNDLLLCSISTDIRSWFISSTIRSANSRTPLFLQQFRSKVERLVSSSIILDICRSASLFDLEIRQAQVNGRNKEIVGCDRRGSLRRVNQEVIFDPSRTLHQLFPMSPLTHLWLWC
jgi:hypothetical protein